MFEFTYCRKNDCLHSFVVIRGMWFWNPFELPNRLFRSWKPILESIQWHSLLRDGLTFQEPSLHFLSDECSAHHFPDASDAERLFEWGPKIWLNYWYGFWRVIIRLSHQIWVPMSFIPRMLKGLRKRLALPLKGELLALYAEAIYVDFEMGGFCDRILPMWRLMWDLNWSIWPFPSLLVGEYFTQIDPPTRIVRGFGSLFDLCFARIFAI